MTTPAQAPLHCGFRIADFGLLRFLPQPATRDPQSAIRNHQSAIVVALPAGVAPAVSTVTGWQLHSLPSGAFHVLPGSRGGTCTRFLPLCRRAPRSSASRPRSSNPKLQIPNSKQQSAICNPQAMGCPTGVEPVPRDSQSRVLIRHTQDTTNRAAWSDGEELNLHRLFIRQPCSPLHHRPTAFRIWSGWPDLNRRPPGSKPGALRKLSYIPSTPLPYSFGRPRVGLGRRAYKARQCHRH